ncbi:MAG: hypothetical protein AB1505_14580, partial [Candidatus Latescibacterota bacterium]
MAALSPLASLSSALALGEGFQFHVLVCDSARQASAALRELFEGLERDAGLVRVAHIDPYAERSTLQPLSFAELSAAVLEPLAAGPAAPRLTAIDASRATPADMGAWRELFRRLNERRNAIASTLAGALLVVVPPALETALAQQAPDLWSIRGTTVVLPSAPRREPAAAQDRAPSDTEPGLVGVDTATAEGALGAAMRQASEAATPAALRAALVHLTRLARREQASGALATARAAYGEALRAAERLLLAGRRRPEDEDSLRGILSGLGAVQQAQGDVAGAVGSYGRALEISSKLAAGDPGSVQWQRELAMSHSQLGDVQQTQGDLAGALESGRRALEIRGRLAAGDPSNVQWQRELAMSHSQLGDVQQAQGDVAGALESCRRALEIRGKLAAGDPGNAQWQRELAVGHSQLGDEQQAQGDV